MNMVERPRQAEGISEAEVRNATAVLDSIGVELTQDQQRTVDSFHLRQQLKTSPEAVLCRFGDRISRLGFNEDAQEIFSSFLRGALVLEGEEALIELCLRIDGLEDEQLALGVDSFVTQTPDLLREYQVGTLQEAFEKIKAIGKTKVYVWNYSSNTYQLLESMTEEQLSVLPWGGTIQIGGPNPSVEATLAIARDFSFEFGVATLHINGIKFSLSENDDYFSMN